MSKTNDEVTLTFKRYFDKKGKPLCEGCRLVALDYGGADCCEYADTSISYYEQLRPSTSCPIHHPTGEAL